MVSAEQQGVPEVSKDAILEESARLMADHGYLGTSLVDVAERFGVTRQALYYHFPKKHDILFAISVGVFERLLEVCGALADTVPPADRFRQMVLAHARVIADRPHWAAVLISEDGHLPSKLREVVYAQRAAFYQLLGAAYEAGVEAGTLKPFPTASILRIAIAPGNWTARWFRPGGDVGVEEMLAMVDAAVFAGLAKND